jgi:hypothetical protein
LLLDEGNSELITLKTRTGDLSLVSQKSPTVMFLSFYAYSARLLLLACSCASSDPGEENWQLKNTVAELTLDKTMLQDVLSFKSTCG